MAFKRPSFRAPRLLTSRDLREIEDPTTDMGAAFASASRLVSPNGTEWVLEVDNEGELTVVEAEEE